MRPSAAPELKEAANTAGREERQTLCLPALEVNGLTVVYPGCTRPAVAGLQASVAAGEAFGLLGPNGAGKTTTISVLCTLLKPTAGTVRVDGFDVRAEAREVRRRIGLVPQEIALYPRLTARENLRYFGRLYGLKALDLEERVAEVLGLVRLEEHADRLVGAFSGGMKRRANLAAGILHRPRILVLDEPTVGIDPQSRNLILEYLAGLRHSNTTLLYTTHHMEEAQQLCSRVAVMDNGRIIAEGAPGELVAGYGCRDLEEVFLQLTGRQLRD